MVKGERIALIDYGAGNLTSVRKGFAAAGARLFTAQTPGDLSGAAAIVVPGVGHFGATAALTLAVMALGIAPAAILELARAAAVDLLDPGAYVAATGLAGDTP